MLVEFADIALAANGQDGTFQITDQGGVVPYVPQLSDADGQDYAVALVSPFEEGESVVSLAGGELVGVWTDLGTGTVYVDRVVHVKGSITDALRIARAFSQIAIWDFKAGREIRVPSY